MYENVLEFITKRRSIRQFTGEPIEQERLDALLKAAMAAPSANNKRPWHFVVVTEKEKIVTLCKAHPYAGFGVDAGAVIIPFGEKEGYKWFDQDMAAATENLLLAVANLGLGATWCGMDEAKQGSNLGLGATWCGMDEAKQGSIRSLIGLPNDQYAFALVPIGLPSEEKALRTQYDKERIHWERY
jgi:nitroreductase